MLRHRLATARPATVLNPTCRLRVEQLEQRVVPAVDLILDFDGGFVSSGQGYRIPAITDGFTFSGFTSFANTDGTPGDFAEQVIQIAAGVRADYAPFDVRVIVDNDGVNSFFFDPGDTVIMIVGESRTALGGSDVFGLAPFDVDQDQGRDVGFAFLPPHVQISSLPLRQIRELIDTISHESGHTFGLSHSIESDSQLRQLVTTAPQDPGLDSRFSFEALDSEDFGVYSEANQLGLNVGFNPAQPNDLLTNQTLPNDTPGIVARPDIFVGTTSSIDFFGDRDAFRFVVPSTGSFTVRMIGDPGTGIDPVISLFSEDGEALFSSGAGGTLTFDAPAGTSLYVVAGTSFDEFTGVPDNGAVGFYSLEMGPTALANSTVFEAELTGGDPTFNVGPDAPGGFGGDDVPGIGGPVGNPPPTDSATLLVINRLVIENLQRVFAQPIPPGSGILAASITGVSDVDGDGFDDVSAVVVLQGARGRLMVFRLVFDGISPGGELIGAPQVTIM